MSTCACDEGTTAVTVREPCTCGAAKWWDCRCAVIAEYEVVTHDTIPNDFQLCWIRTEHPGCVLVYFDPRGATYELTRGPRPCPTP